ncbi:MAG: nitroreductase family protein [Candidatus Bipolaricaulota bacterium]|nr:nitroreductase family protein [Candidatus Bipolaricaulota bacterium]
MADLLRLIQTRRSMRAFTAAPVSRADIEKILNAGRWAPSGKNTQPWRFVVVESVGKREALAKLAPQAGMIATAPLTLAVLCDRDAGYDELKDAQGIGAAIENILLAVHSLGLGACWMGKARNAEIELIVEAREHEELMALIPIGHPAGNSNDVSRHPLETITRFI